MPNINALLTIVLLLFILSGSPCMAGVWKDDFSDPTLRSWGGSMDDGNHIARVENEQFHYKGLNDRANFVFKNGSLSEIKSFTLKFEWKAERINNGEGLWGFGYRAYDETGKTLTRLINFNLIYIAVADTVTLKIDKGTPQNASEEMLLRVYFKPEKSVWHSLKLDKTNESQYKLSIDDEILGEFQDNSVPSGNFAIIFQNMLDVYIDDFMLISPDVQDGGPGMKSPNPIDKLSTTWGKIKL